MVGVDDERAFTDQARRVLVIACEQALRLNHPFVGTEHLLFAIVGERDGLAAEALASVGVSLQALREKLDATALPAGTNPTAVLPFSPWATLVLKRSIPQAHSLGQRHAGTEAIFLVLLREPNSAAARTLVDLGASLSDVRQQRDRTHLRFFCSLLDIAVSHSGQVGGQSGATGAR